MENRAWLDLRHQGDHHQFMRKQCVFMVTFLGVTSGLGLQADSSWAQAIDPQPSEAEQRIIQRKIEAVRNQIERSAVENQSLAWKMTTFLCQPAARDILKKMGSDSRFFLQDDKPDSQVFVSPSLLSGRGQYRKAQHSIEWVPFAWTCHLDPQTGKVRRFDVMPFPTEKGKTAESHYCAASDLQLVLDSQNGAFDGMSHTGTFMTVKNKGGKACLLPAYPSVQFQTDDGKSVPVKRQAADGDTPAEDTLQTGIDLVLPRQSALHSALRWVSGDVYGGPHDCHTVTSLVVTVGGNRLSYPLHSIFCSPEQGRVVVEQSPLSSQASVP